MGRNTNFNAFNPDGNGGTGSKVVFTGVNPLIAASELSLLSELNFRIGNVAERPDLDSAERAKDALGDDGNGVPLRGG